MVSGTVKSINNQASRSPETATGSARGIPPASTFPSTSVQSVSGTMAKPYAFATLLTADEYLPGCLTCVHSLKDTQSTAVPDGPDAVEYETVCLVTQETVSVEAVKQVKTAFDTLLFVDAIQSCSLKELALLGTFTLCSHAFSSIFQADFVVKVALSSSIRSPSCISSDSFSTSESSTSTPTLSLSNHYHISSLTAPPIPFPQLQMSGGQTPSIPVL